MAEKVSAAEYAERETKLGLLPMRTDQRLWGMTDVLWVAGATGIATWAFLQGYYTAGYNTMPQALASLFGGIMVFILLVAMVAVPATKYGIDSWIVFRSSIGFNGVYPLLILAMASGFGWHAVNTQIYGLAWTNLLSTAGWEGVSSSPWIGKAIAITCPLFALMIAAKGPKAVGIATRIMCSLLIVLGILMAVIVLARGGLSDVWNSAPLWGEAPSRTNYMISVEWQVAFAVSWAPAIGQLTRVAKKELHGFWGLYWGYGFVMAAYIVIGVIVAYAAASMGAEVTSDPTQYLYTVGGPWAGTLSLMIVIIANISTTAVSIWCLSLSVKLVWPSWPYMRVALGCTGYIVALVLWGGLIENFGSFLAIVGATNGTLLALIIADYYVVRRRRLDIAGLYDRHGSYKFTGGFNLPGIVAYALGFGAYLLVYDPIAAVPRAEGLFNVFTATGFGALVTAGAYILFAHVPGVRGYVLKDRGLAR